ncbi:DUF6468 domain-containing protein [Ponticaulis sp.]|jgi:hypothetical protein|uniref:DUF6468 domain-containing protein n=1 Tax=Ponticaulis sp. TaxID=2020902 RepID=UPI000B6BFBC0|nr:DUF6468 domain-containing protein [Ponticaulis sp.]MAJ08995.1 hypothetical protein [Ponticaulis sp.]RPG16790.1 MAG: hypothetical protein CBC85_007675 [Hyphomonadaceae bacterium TMED125]HBH90073.1 hypothetical protein [Hyphomonadaceae bacterium]|tara:strand:+ start:66519 stop:66806 length:288 start_codon:yes stop_codon:yes gene_type:complete
MSDYGLFVEIGLAVLLLLTIVYCWRLDQRLNQLRKGNDGMIEAARELAETIAQAEMAVQGLRKSATETGKELQSRIDEARSLSNSLQRGTTRRGY